MGLPVLEAVSIVVLRLHIRDLSRVVWVARETDGLRLPQSEPSDPGPVILKRITVME